jgi:hypothetical protein
MKVCNAIILEMIIAIRQYRIMIIIIIFFFFCLIFTVKKSCFSSPTKIVANCKMRWKEVPNETSKNESTVHFICFLLKVGMHPTFPHRQRPKFPFKLDQVLDCIWVALLGFSFLRVRDGIAYGLYQSKRNSSLLVFAFVTGPMDYCSRCF